MPNEDKAAMTSTRHSAPILLVLSLTLVGCSQFPQLDDRLDEAARSAPYPELVPVESLNAQVPDEQITSKTAKTIEGRVARLRARASTLRRSVVDSGTKARMNRGVAPI